MPTEEKTTFTLTPAEQPVFYRLVDLIHDALAGGRGCHHPKFNPNQCALVARHLWEAGVR